MDHGIIVHGGAWSIPNTTKEDHLEGVKTACEIGYQLLTENVSALDIVEVVISKLEDDPTFDAGLGSHLNNQAEVEMDAIIADQSYNIGAVCGIQNIRNPIKVARLVMEKTEHIVLVGSGASKFAHDSGEEYIHTKDLLIGRELETYKKILREENFSTKDPFTPKKKGFGTVGCVVRDNDRKYAIGVSTGGTPLKLAGRVGDTPLWGAGGYVTTIGGVAATGFGEDLIRILISQRVVGSIKRGMSTQEACEEAIVYLKNEVDGLGGVIALSQEGPGLFFNTKRMAYALQIDDKPLKYGIERRDLSNYLKSFSL